MTSLVSSLQNHEKPQIALALRLGCTYSGKIFVAAGISGLSTMLGVMRHN
jgi:hypothetical protein